MECGKSISPTDNVIEILGVNGYETEWVSPNKIIVRPKWINVKAHLPKDRETVLWVHDLLLRKQHKNMYDGPSQIVGYYMEEINSVCLEDLDEYDQFFRLDQFTHWMPLPTPPLGPFS